MNKRNTLVVCVYVVFSLGSSGVLAQRGGPDDFGYSYVDSSEADGPVFDFEDISMTGTPVTVGDDEMSAAQDIGFSFNYYGTDYTEVYISDNGYISLLPAQRSEFEAQGFPMQNDPAGMDGLTGPDAVIAAWWVDLNPEDGGSIHVETRGMAPFRRFIVQFTDVPYFIGSAAITHQYKLFEGSNVIEIHTVNIGNEGGVTAGIENETGTDGLMYVDDVTIPEPSAVRYSFIGPDPVCSEASASVNQLWPPNHKFVEVEIDGVTDPNGNLILITIDSIFQDEPVNTVGDGNTGPDGRGVGSSTAELRAERSGTRTLPGDGRVYHIGFTAIAGQGQCSGTVSVEVPHDQGKGSFVVDGGALYDSTL